MKMSKFAFHFGYAYSVRNDTENDSEAEIGLEEEISLFVCVYYYFKEKISCTADPNTLKLYIITLVDVALILK